MEGRGSEEELDKSEIGTTGTREAEQEHMRGTTGGLRVHSRSTKDEQRIYNRNITEALN